MSNSLLSRSIYNEERAEFGHTIVLCKPLDDIKPSSIPHIEVINRIINQVAEAITISKKHNRQRSYVHIYTGGCMPDNYSISFYKRLFQKLDEAYEDTLEAAYIYDLPTTAICVWNVLKLFIDPVTRSKVHLVSTSRTNA